MAASARRAPPRRACEPETRVIAIPGWEQVVRLKPRPLITATMREAHYAARRFNQPSPLAPELQREIERRAERARQIRQSPTPEYAKAYGQMLTAIDNVQ